MTSARGGLAALILLGALAAPLAGPDAGLPRAARAAAPGDSAVSPLPLPTGSYTITATRMLGQEDVGGVRHILVEVTVRQKGAILTAPRGYYYTARDLTTLGGGARMIDSTVVVVADSAAYTRDTEVLTGLGNVVLTDRDVRLTGEQGVYERRLERCTLEGRVSGIQGGRSFTGRKMIYERRSGLVFITGNAVVVDSTHDTVVRSERIVYNTRTRLATALQRPALDWTQGSEVLRIEGDRMRFLDDGNRLEVSGRMEARQGRQTVTGDSAYFLDQEAFGRVMGQPRVSDEEGTLTGDSLGLYFVNDKLDRAVMQGNARLVYVPADPDLVGERSEVTGDSLAIYFVDERIDHLLAVGHPTTDYTPSRADSAQGTGRVSAKADSVRITMKDQSVDRVELAGGSSGSYRYLSRSMKDSLDTVLYQASRITFHLPQRLINLEGAASTDYHELTLKADRIDFDAKREVLIAEPHPILIDRGRSVGEEVNGQRVTFDLRTQRGTIYHGYTKYDTGYLFADSLRKISEKELSAASGNYTTCDLAGQGLDPHFHFTSRKMKVYLGDKVVAKPVALYIGRIPLFALPFYVFSLRHGRHSGLLLPRFEFGFSSGAGRFFENLGYYWAASDYTDYSFKLGYREKPGVLIGETTARYVVRGKVDGQVDLGHAWGEARGLNQVTLRHNQTLGPDFRLTGSGEFADPEFRQLRGLGTGIGARVDRQLRSNFGLTRNWRGAGISLNVTAAQEKALDSSLDDGLDDVTLSRTLPSVSASLSTRAVGRKATAERPGRMPWASSLTYSLSFSGTRTESEREKTTRVASTDSTVGDTTATLIRTKNQSGRWSLGVRSNGRLFGVLNFSPSVNLTENWVDREFTATDTLLGFRRAAVYSLALTTGTTLYGTLSPGLGPLRSLRHTLSPSVSLVYNPDFRNLTYENAQGRRVSRYPGVSAAQSQSLVYSVENRFQAKVRGGADEIRRINLFSWTAGGSYDILAGSRHEARPASNISNSVNINQIKALGLDFRSENDPYHQLRFQSFSLNGRVAFNGVLPGSGGGGAPASGPGRTAGGTTALPGFDSTPSIYDDQGGASTGARAGSDALAWSAGFGLSYGGSRTDASGLEGRAQLNSNVTCRLSQNWNMTYGSLYAFKEHQFNYQRIELHRDLHCWEAVFTYSATPLTSEFYFRISVKALPDIKFEQGPGLGATGALGRLVPTGGF